jgi:hypothetical protein
MSYPAGVVTREPIVTEIPLATKEGGAMPRNRRDGPRYSAPVIGGWQLMQPEGAAVLPLARSFE